MDVEKKITAALKNLLSEDPEDTQKQSLQTFANVFTSGAKKVDSDEQAKEIIHLYNIAKSLHPFIKAGLRYFVAEENICNAYRMANHKLGINVNISNSNNVTVILPSSDSKENSGKQPPNHPPNTSPSGDDDGFLKRLLKAIVLKFIS
jgi:hypothetical protein